VKRHLALGPQPLHHADLLDEVAAPRLEVDATRRELGFLPARAEAELETSVRKLIERRGLFGEQRRRTQRRQQHAGREPDALRRGRHGREHRHRLPPWEIERRRPRPVRILVRLLAHHDVVRDHEVRETGRFRELRGPDHHGRVAELMRKTVRVYGKTDRHGCSGPRRA
jgi:hypothetical protein